MATRSCARVLLVGVGGLGCPAALVLARAGIGALGIADDDEVDVSNLHRQILFREEDVGRPKVDVAAARLRAVAPDLVVEAHATRLLPHNAVELARAYDVVVEGSDNFPTKFLASDAAALAERPIVHGAALRWHGTALAVGRTRRPCYRCLFEDVPTGPAPSCDDAGVVGPVVGVVAAAQVDLALRMWRGEDVAGTLVTFDGRTMDARRRVVPRRRDCPTCGDSPTLEAIDPARYVAAACEVGL